MALREADSLEEAEDIELALGAELGDDLVGREFLDADDDAFTDRAKRGREAGEGLLGQPFEVGKGWRGEGGKIRHRAAICMNRR